MEHQISRGLRCAQRAGIQSVARQITALEVLDDHVCVAAQSRVPAADPQRVREVRDHRTLAAVAGMEIGGVATAIGVLDERRPPAARLVAVRALDLDHIRAQVGQHLPRPGPGQNARQFQHPDARQRPFHARIRWFITVASLVELQAAGAVLESRAMRFNTGGRPGPADSAPSDLAWRVIGLVNLYRLLVAGGLVHRQPRSTRSTNCSSSSDPTRMAVICAMYFLAGIGLIAPAPAALCGPAHAGADACAGRFRRHRAASSGPAAACMSGTGHPAAAARRRHGAAGQQPRRLLHGCDGDGCRAGAAGGL